MNYSKEFMPQPRTKILVSRDFAEILIAKESSIIEQRIIAVILSALKSDQKLFLNRRQTDITSKSQQLSFDDYFEGWANQGHVSFALPFKDTNPGKKMKNSAIQTALINMSNLKWVRLKDEKISGFRAVPFIINPSWNRHSILFQMDRAIFQLLMNVSHYYQMKKNLAFATSSANTIKFLLYIMRFKQRMFGKVLYKNLLQDLSLPQGKYEGLYRFKRDFLDPVKADLDEYNDLSFNYVIKRDLLSFVLYHTKQAVGPNQSYKTEEDLKISRAVRYLKKVRKLTDEQGFRIQQTYESEGYKPVALMTKRKIDLQLKGEDYIRAFYQQLAKD